MGAYLHPEAIHHSSSGDATVTLSCSTAAAVPLSISVILQHLLIHIAEN